jgi:hypothetical protein
VADWTVAVVDLAGNERTFPEASALSYTRRLRGYCEAEFKLETVDLAGAQLVIASRAVKLYRNAVLRHHGQIVPFDADEEWTTVRSADPWFFAAYRFLQSRYSNTADLAQVLWALVAAQNARRTLRIQQGTLAVVPAQAVDFDEGKSLETAAADLVALNPSMWFVIDPVDGVAGTLAELAVRYPASGTDRTDALRFEYGDGTLANLAGFKIEWKLPKNGVTARGSGEGDVAPTGRADDAASQLEYGLIEDDVAFSDVNSTARLNTLAAGELEPDGSVVFSLTAGPDTPMLFDDFDVGDLASVRIRHGWVDFHGTARILEATVEAEDESNDERLTRLVVEAV